MDKHAALDILRTNEAELRRRGVLHAALFGSVARGEARADSDFDDLFPIQVDAVCRDALKDRVCTHADRDAIPDF